MAIIRLEERDVDRITTGRAYNEYRTICGEIQLDELTQRRCTDLISELDMLGIVNAAVISKGRYGRTKDITVSVPTGQVRAILETDSRLEALS